MHLSKCYRWSLVLFLTISLFVGLILKRNVGFDRVASSVISRLSEAQEGRQKQILGRSGVTPDMNGATDYQIPPHNQLLKMNFSSQLTIYWRYINMLQVLCREVVRVGKLTDGGKEICIDEPYKPKQPCIVYSFGSNNQFDFDEHAMVRFGCEVFVFDPSMNRESGKVKDGIWFYNYGLGGKNEVTNNKWQLKTLDTIINELGHSNKTIDILKIDIELGEWIAIPQMISSRAIHAVKQIAMETHFTGRHQPAQKLSVLRQLYDAGFRMFMRERNLAAGKANTRYIDEVHGTATIINEISLLNIRL